MPQPWVQQKCKSCYIHPSVPDGSCWPRHENISPKIQYTVNHTPQNWQPVNQFHSSLLQQCLWYQTPSVYLGWVHPLALLVRQSKVICFNIPHINIYHQEFIAHFMPASPQQFYRESKSSPIWDLTRLMTSTLFCPMLMWYSFIFSGFTWDIYSYITESYHFPCMKDF